MLSGIGLGGLEQIGPVRVCVRVEAKLLLLPLDGYVLRLIATRTRARISVCPGATADLVVIVECFELLLVPVAASHCAPSTPPFVI